MASSSPLDPDSPAVHTHLNILQGVIQRMAENSRACKVWCVTLVAATLVLVARTGEPQHALLALVPTVLFCVLDAYYLALERAFRKAYNRFVVALHASELDAADVFKIAPQGMGIALVGRCLASVSIWVFYPLLVVTIILAWLIVIPSDPLPRPGGW